MPLARAPMPFVTVAQEKRDFKIFVILITAWSRVQVLDGPPSSCDKKDVSRFCRIKSRENEFLGIIPKSSFFIDIKKYFWFSTRICHTACNEFAKQLSDLQAENHSLGEWFKRRLMSIMGKEKLPLLYWKCGLRTAQASKVRSFKNERRK